MGREVFTLGDAVRLGQIITVKCGCCHRRRYFHPADWLRLLGDVPCYDLERSLTCHTCKTADYVRADFDLMPATQRQRIRLRRIKEIKMVQKVIWQDE